ncbi:MAG: HNH endonuclease, partial [Oscillospiraceae bacterium]|nr:HNH endonuclease [Oscillospiraceae bacterium]
LLPGIRSTGKRLGKNPADALSAVLKQRFGAKIPGDEQFERILLHRNAYSLNSRTRAALFDSLENGTNSGERIPVFEGLAGKQLSTEHIMPQGLSNVWRSALGADASRIHKTYVNTLCNLTVSGYNNEYSNRPFKEKRDGFVTPEGEAIPGFRDSPYRLSRYVASCKVWTEREMLERNRLLSQRIARVFPMPWDAGVSAPAPTAEKPREVQPAPAPVAAPPAPPAPSRTPASLPAAIKGGAGGSDAS